MKNLNFLTDLRNSDQVITRLRPGNNQVKTTLRFIALLTLILTIGVGQMKAEVITLTKNSLGTDGGYHDGAEQDATIGTVDFTYVNLMTSGNNIQVKASTGEWWNTSIVPGKITNVSATHSGTARNGVLYWGTSAKTTSNSTNANGSFNCNSPTGCFGYVHYKRNSSSAAYWTQVVITYTPATITPSTSSVSGLDYNVGSGPSAAQSFTVSGSNIPANLVVTAPTNFEVSLNGSSWASSQTISVTTSGSSGGTLGNTTVYVRLASGKSAGNYSGNVSIEIDGANDKTGTTPKTVAVSGTVSAGSVAVTGVTVDPTSKSIVPGQTFDITPTISPSNATDKVVSWTSSPTTYATVSNGTVTGVAAGSSTITCTTHDGGYTATCAVTVRAVTMQARDEDGNAIAGGGPGAPTRSGASIAPAADAGNYVFKEWQITNASLGSSASTKSNTITNPTGAVTVTAVYYKPITITYKANNQVFTTQTYGYGGTLAFPVSNPTPGTYSCDGKTFVGWVGEANKDYSHASIAPTYATAGGSVTAAATYYAVFATAGAGGATTYTKVTTISAGTYLMATETSAQYTAIGTAAYTGDDGSGKRGSSVSVSISTGVISTKPATALEITVTLGTGDDAGYFAMYDGSKYITQGAKNEFAFVDDISYQWDLNASGQIHQKGTFNNSDDNRIYFDNGNSGSSPNLFKPMTSRSEGNNNSNYYYHAYLFKKSGGVTYSDYATTCGQTIYLKDNANWRTGGSKYAVYYWNPEDGNDHDWSEFMTAQADCESTWKTTIPSNYTNMKFVRFPSGKGTPAFDGDVQNQTGNLTIPTNKNCFTLPSDAWDGTTNGTSDANWSAYAQKVTVSFDKNTSANGVTNPADQCVVKSTGYATEPTIGDMSYDRLGYQLNGWWTAADGGTQITFNEQTYTSDTELHAHWSVGSTTTVYLLPTWSGEGNTWLKDNSIVFAHFYIDGTTQSYDVQMTGNSCDDVMTAEAPYGATHVSFARCTSGTVAGDLSATWATNGHVQNYVVGCEIGGTNYFAVLNWGSYGQKEGGKERKNTSYEPVSYTITYNAGTNGTGSRANDSKACGVAFTLPNSQVFTRNGYTMDGWATSDGGDKSYNLGGSYTTDANLNLYPHWREATYTVTLTTNGGTINAGNVENYTYGTGATLPTNVTKDHATFQGWYASSTFEGDRVYTIGTTEYGNKQYYAKWEDIKWTVTWKANGETFHTDNNVVDGNTLSAPTPAPGNLTTGSNGCDAEFVGWVLEDNDPGALSISSQSSTPSGLFTTTSPAITANTTFVAIYRQEQ